MTVPLFTAPMIAAILAVWLCGIRAANSGCCRKIIIAQLQKKSLSMLSLVVSLRNYFYELRRD